MHYLIGFPPLRGGGMIGYALSVSKEQKKQGHCVSLLVPGTIYGRCNPRVRVKRKGKYDGIPVYMIFNPLPISMGNGIKDIEWFTYDAGYDEYVKFFSKEKPEVLHIHSLMGIHRSMLLAARAVGVTTIYTTHDYFGICPTTIMMWRNAPCDGDNRAERCAVCCRNAFSEKHLILDQSLLGNIIGAIYSSLGIRSISLPVLSIIRKQNQVCLNKRQKNKNGLWEQSVQDELLEGMKHYSILLKDYAQKFDYIDRFHFNSEQSELIFRRYLKGIYGQRLWILSAYCKDDRIIREYDSSRLRVGFMGSMMKEKGGDVLLAAIRQVRKEGVNAELYWCCNMQQENAKEDYIHVLPVYKNRKQFVQSMSKIDIMVVPSICRETFGLTIIEAISQGIPVILTDCVGAKDLLKDDIGMMISGRKETLQEAIVEALRKIWKEPNLLTKWNRNICTANINVDFSYHVETLTNKIYASCD